MANGPGHGSRHVSPAPRRERSSPAGRVDAWLNLPAQMLEHLVVGSSDDFAAERRFNPVIERLQVRRPFRLAQDHRIIGFVSTVTISSPLDTAPSGGEIG